MCNAKIHINGETYKCDQPDDDHDGMHFSLVVLDPNVTEGIAWNIFDGGQVVLEISPEVGEKLFGNPFPEHIEVICPN